MTLLCFSVYRNLLWFLSSMKKWISTFDITDALHFLFQISAAVQILGNYFRGLQYCKTKHNLQCSHYHHHHYPETASAVGGFMHALMPVLLPYRDYHCNTEDICSHFSTAIFSDVHIRLSSFHILLPLGLSSAIYFLTICFQSTFRSGSYLPPLYKLKTPFCIPENTQDFRSQFQDQKQFYIYSAKVYK